MGIYWETVAPKRACGLFCCKREKIGQRNRELPRRLLADSQQSYNPLVDHSGCVGCNRHSGGFIRSLKRYWNGNKGMCSVGAIEAAGQGGRGPSAPRSPRSRPLLLAATTAPASAQHPPCSQKIQRPRPLLPPPATATAPLKSCTALASRLQWL